VKVLQAYFKPKEDTEEREEETAWRLLLEENARMEEEEETMIVNLFNRESLETQIKIQAKPDDIVECEAVVDTGSPLTFMSLENVKTFAPQLLKQTSPYPVRITGVTGEPVKVKGSITLACEVAGKTVSHEFVIADIVEPVLLGVDFMRKHQATWDWLAGELIYQEGEPTLRPQACKLMEAEEIPPQSIRCYRVEACGVPPQEGPIHVTGDLLGSPGLVVGDVLGIPQGGTMDVIVENRTEEAHLLPAGTMMGQWETMGQDQKVFAFQVGRENQEERAICALLEDPKVNSSEKEVMMEALIATLPTEEDGLTKEREG